MHEKTSLQELRKLQKKLAGEPEEDEIKPKRMQKQKPSWKQKIFGAKTAKKQGEEREEPREGEGEGVKKIVLKAKHLLSSKQLKEKLAELSFAKIDEKNSKITLTAVESEDLNHKPHLYTRMAFTAEGVEIEYSITPETDAHVREIEACKFALSVLAFTQSHEIKLPQVYALTANAFEKSLEIANEDYEQLKKRTAELEARTKTSEKKYAEQIKTSEKLSRSLVENEQQQKQLENRVKQLEGMNDEPLAQEIYSWIKTHGGKFNAHEFTKTHGVPHARVEEGINKLMKEGYIAKN